MRSLKAFNDPHNSLTSIVTMTSAWPIMARRKDWFSGCREGKFMRPALSMTAHCSVKRHKCSNARLAADHAIANHYWVLCCHKHLREFGKRRRISLRGNHLGELRNAKRIRPIDRVLL